MSTQSNTPKVRQGIGLTVLSILSGLLLALQFLLSPVAFASHQRLAAPSFAPQGVLDLAGVSVVRLVVEYTGTTTHLTTQCTGLGTLVASWSPTSPTEENNWVLTDSTLVNVNGQTCVATTKGLLTAIKLYANTLYTNSMLNLAQLAVLQCHQITGQQKATCSDRASETPLPAQGGALLLSFHTDAAHLQPFLPVTAQATGTTVGIELANGTTSTGALPPRPNLPATDNPLTYLSPKLYSNNAASSTSTTPTRTTGSATAATSGEPGMPLVDSAGNVVGMSVTSGAPLNGPTLLNLLNQQPALQAPHPNNLNSTWESGIAQYEAGNYAGAEATLKQIASANPQFQAPFTYEGKAAAQIPHGTNGPSTSTTSSSPAQEGNPAILVIGLVAGLLILITLLVISTLLVGRVKRQRELAHFEAERKAAQRDADLDMQQRQQQARQQGKAAEMPQQALLLQHVVLEEQKASIPYPQAPPEKLCPNCGRIVRADATYCPNCRYQLSPAVPGALPTLRTSPTPELPISEKAPASPITSQSQQALVKETVPDDQAIRAALQRLWDRSARKE
ncbi:MAG TPA: zinc ribbon domain-containing protein [Ktedonobacteraceae bacterium]|nr:zinc ribbon domain-containing protein [Ktedonobacteraceae bacterium]